jgi:molybdopterin-binding protein
MTGFLEYDATVAARDVTVRLSVARGETVALLGPNGAGKSTVLGVTSGLLSPSAGRVVLGGRELASARRCVPPHQRGVALLAQEPLLFPHLTVLDNVAFGPRARSRRPRRADADATARAWLERMGVAELADRKPREVSGGQAQRVAVARALAAAPDLLLLDEPMAALDVTVTPALRQTLRDVLAHQTTLLVTHDALDALLLSDRVVVLDRGRVVEEGPTSEVLSRPRRTFAARIAGLNLVAGRWDGGAVVASALVVRGLAGEPAPAPGDAAVALFAPSAVSVYREAPAGSPRNRYAAVVTDLEPLGDRIRVITDVAGQHVAAEITPAALSELDLGPGTPVHLTVKATEVTVHAAGGSLVPSAG